jgi:citrate lyase subunit beta / citryl-CoA lyase
MLRTVNGQQVALRRSLLWVAGDDISNMESRAKWGADVVTLDVEDTVKASDKPRARKVIAEALRDLSFGSAERWVRVNGFHTPFAFDDLEVIVPARPDAIRLPKIQIADDVRLLERLLLEIERKHQLELGSTRVVLNIESASAVLNLYEIAKVSKRVIGMVLGGEDFTDDLGIPRPTRGLELSMLFGRQQLITVARALRVMPFDSVFLDAEDEEGLRAETEMVRDLGMVGKNVIHPKQVRIVNEVFTPTKEQISFAVRAVKAYEEAQKSKGTRSDGSSGVLPYVDGKFIGPPVVGKAHQVISRAEACGAEIRA